MKKTRHFVPTVNYKKRHDTTFTVKPRRLKGLAGVRTNANFSEQTVDEVDNLELGITITEPNTARENDFPINTQSTEETTEDAGANSGLNILNESFELKDDLESVVVDEISETEEDTTFVPTMSNTKKEILAFADSLGIEVKGNWSKKKILDAIQN